MIRFYIFAGTHEQAKHLARKMKLGANEWVYVSRMEQLQGIRDAVMLMYGSWRLKEHLSEFMDMARVREMNILYVE